jgi:hypothetical protein
MKHLFCAGDEMETNEDIRDVLAFLRGLVARPEDLLALRLRDTNDIVVVERGAGKDGDLMAVRLLPDRRTVLGRLDHGRWQLAHPRSSSKPNGMQVLGRVLSVIHPVRSNAQPQIA